ncbi:cytochrome c maturation protein CcmE [Novosphingobium resinovorum]|uniref:Cytochrome c-type biogenesis protein CcmE n=1 Tax=Novosphingobium resinovorum TaxID=158500 RepID=A0A1D8A0A4_9SPHN|nr:MULTISPECIES: cytochrome c maturation protein CcmE [Novosphingobium]AOR75541.1 cytochrome c biogenesis protein CcmE [Novosphingobium resinovorum]MBF7010863.1 cytochrome c maturation protein CcmE [Novosphingobium sp. HR1a]WJM28860.1 cytochrome c maturation protein CcmE [Novosphingobium resinovorum]
MATVAKSPIKAKHQRLVLLIVALVVLIGAALLAAWALRNQASYFYVPSEIVARPPEPGRAVRLGGMVEKGSLKTAADGVTINFAVQDGKARVPVTFKGIVPSLFVEGSGVVAEGKMGTDGTFVADNLLAKHDENYVPHEMQDMSREQAQKVMQETK